MAWLEITFNIQERLANSAQDILEKCGALAVSFFDAGDVPILEPLPGSAPLWNHVKMVGLFPQETDVASLNQTFKAAFPEIDLTATPLPEQDWTRTYLEHFHPMQFGQKLWICPFEQTHLIQDEHAVIVTLDPGLAFGTGTHPTTALCLTWLDANPPTQQIVMDYGCGSGILGVASLCLGAKQVFAIDYDPQALVSTQENAKRNGFSDEQLIAFAPEDLPPLLAQSVLANILAQPLITLAPTLAQHCAPGGNIVLSGLLSHQAESVMGAYLPWFNFHEPLEQEGWVLLSGIKKS